MSEENFDKQLVLVISACLERLLLSGAAAEGQVTKFHALKPPSISVLAYLERIHQYANCSQPCFVIALIYIDRLCQMSIISLSALNVHRIIITAVCIAAKFHDDSYYNNTFYSQLGGIPLKELNTLEVEFLFGVNFTLKIDSAVYEKYTAALQQGTQPVPLHDALQRLNTDAMMQ
ncbi:cyclin-domain-containing protein [Pelagophyceae sp. CCMP2097]|nr:cyclin-domain-containing protein [Pelagophyceae sp. CCMP2097]